jgi:hypothetical protein
MRSAIRLVLLTPFISAGLIATSGSAQSLTPCMRTVRIGMERDIFFPRANAHVAYTAIVKQTYEQNFTDGNTEHWTLETIQARDEAGRTMRQHIEGCALDGSGQPQLRLQTAVNDPSAKTNAFWSTGLGTMALVTLVHQQIQTPPPDWKDIPRTPMPNYRPAVTREDLGTRTIAGIEATGSRITQIMPAGSEGNDMPIKTVSETWLDKQNHVTLMAVTEDPRTGRHTWEVESLTIGPPDRALFTPPANYKVWEQNIQTQVAVSAATP